MANKNIKGAVVVLSVVAIAGGAVYYLTQSKRHFARSIVKMGGASNYPKLLTFDEGYLRQWAKYLRKGEETFAYQGKKYKTVGGTEVVS